MTDVQKITGTDAYYEYASKRGICQNKATLSECGAKVFTERLLQECKCIPYELLHILDENNVDMCTSEGRECYNRILEKETFCTKPCTGFYADIRVTQYNNNNSILTKEDMEVKSMISDYEKFKGKLMTKDGEMLHHAYEYISTIAG